MATFRDPKLRECHEAFLRMEPHARPLIGTWLFGFYNHEQYPNLIEPLTPGQEVSPDDLQTDLFIKDVENLYQGYSELDDDFPWIGGAFYGVPWLEAIMGCPVFFSGTNMYSKPILEDWDDYDWKRPSLDTDPWVQRLLEMMDALVEHSQGRYLVGPTLMRGPIDMVSAMRGGTQMVYDAFDNPDRLKRLAELCADVWIEIGKLQHKHTPDTPETGYGCGCAGLRIWSPEAKAIWMQEDATSLLSPGIYDDLFRESDARICQAFPFVAFHLHGTVLWPVDAILEIEEIDALNLNYDIGVTKLEDIIPAWGRIIGRKPLVAHGNFASREEWERALEVLWHGGVAIQSLSPTIEGGREIRARIFNGKWPDNKA